MRTRFERRCSPWSVCGLAGPALVVVGSLWTGGCSGGAARTERTAETEGANSSLMALGSADADGFLMQDIEELDESPSTEDLVNQAAVDLEKLLGAGGRLRPQARVASADNESGLASSPSSGEDQEASAGLNSLAGTQDVSIAAPDPYVLRQADEAWEEEGAKVAARRVSAPERDGSTPNDRLLALASKLAALLRETKANGESVLAPEVALGAIEALSPGSVKSLDQEGSVLRAGLSAQDFETLSQARLRTSGGTQVSGAQLREVIEAVTPAPAELRITASKLCTRVMGFGRYDEITTPAFRAGKSSKAIVYTELDGFQARPAQKGDPLAKDAEVSEQVSVELEQSLTLYQDADGYQAWHRPPQRVIETSRTKRRDFYLIQIIELPAALTIGKYNLKVAVKDVTTGTTTESIIPVEIVAGS